MYQYDDYDRALVRERVAQFRDQVQRRLGQRPHDDQRGVFEPGQRDATTRGLHRLPAGFPGILARLRAGRRRLGRFRGGLRRRRRRFGRTGCQQAQGKDRQEGKQGFHDGPRKDGQ